MEIYQKINDLENKILEDIDDANLDVGIVRLLLKSILSDVENLYYEQILKKDLGGNE